MGRRIKCYLIDTWMLAQFLRSLDGQMLPHMRIDGFPKDGKIVGIQVETGLLDRLRIYVHSEAFEEVPEGVAPPEAYLMVTKWNCPSFVQLESAKPAAMY